MAIQHLTRSTAETDSRAHERDDAKLAGLKFSTYGGRARGK
jgi:hypothetical protein